MKTGILGGTFNPIHNGHLLIANAALEYCGLDRVLFLPAANPPHKQIAAEVSFEHRLAMVKLAIADNPKFIASDLEAKRPGRSFSVDTLRQMQQSHPDDEFYFIIGLDSFRDITTWKNFRQLFELANIVIATRPGPGADDPYQFLPVAIKDDFCYDEKSLKLRHKSGRELFFIEETNLDISSTRIRERVAQGRSIRGVVAPLVADYIERYDLYRDTER